MTDPKLLRHARSHRQPLTHRARGLVATGASLVFSALALACSSGSASRQVAPGPPADAPAPSIPVPATGPSASVSTPDPSATLPAMSSGPGSPTVAPDGTAIAAGGSLGVGGSLGGVAGGGGTSGAGGMAAGTGGAAGTEGAAGTGGAAGPPPIGPDGLPGGCAEDLPLPAEATQRTAVNVTLEWNEQPFVFGERNTLATGGTVLPTNFRFYLSNFSLLRGTERLPALVTDAAGAPAPYGVQLVNGEDASLSFQLASAPGDYDGVSFVMGLSEGCNATLTALNPPLDEAAQLKWPHTLGFLFLRFEGQVSEDADPTTPSKIHMGAAGGEDGFAPVFTLNLPVAASNPTLELVLSVDAVLRAATTETDLSNFTLPLLPIIDEEIKAGERLRRAANTVQLFDGQMLQ